MRTEILPLMLMFVAVTNGKRTCLQGWTKENDSCYKLFIMRLSWEDAEKQCEKMSTRLVTLNDQDEQNFVLTLMRNVNVDAIWIGLVRNSTEWTWTDINATTLNHLIATNSSTVLGNSCAVVSYTGEWLPEICDLQKPFLCETNITGCPTALGWIEHDFRCLFILSTKHDWTSSRIECNSIGAELAVLNDLKADSFLQSQSTLFDWLWVGLQFGNNYHNYTWIDGRAGYVENVTTVAQMRNDACGAVSVDQKSRKLISMATSCKTQLFAVCEKAWIEETRTTYQPKNVSISDETTVTPQALILANELELTPLMDSQKETCNMVVRCLKRANPITRFKCMNDVLCARSDDYHPILETVITLKTIDEDTKIKLIKFLLLAVGSLHHRSPIFCDDKPKFELLNWFEGFVGTFITSEYQTTLDLKSEGRSVSAFALNISRSYDHIYEGTSVGCVVQSISTQFQGDDVIESGENLVLSIILLETLNANIDFENWSWGYDFYIISAVMTLSVYHNGSKYNAGLSFTLLHTFGTDQEVLQLFKRNTTSILCAFYKPDKRKWSTDGCRKIKTDAYITACECNHTTSFAILMKVKNYRMTQGHKTALSVITSIGCSVSMIAMFISLTVFTCVRSLISERVFVHRNLCVAIMSAQIIFLAGIKATYHKTVCRVIAILLHYCYVSMFTWMLVEGLHLYTKVVQVFGTAKSRISYYFFFGWGIPFILVAISSVANFDGYGTDDSCWLSIRRNTIWAFAGPAIAVIVVNIAILVMVLRILVKSVRLERPKYRDQIMAAVKGTFFLLPLLGLTWMFGLLAINDRLIVFEYAFAICNSLQGFFVFLFHCVMNSEVRHALRRLRDRRSFELRGEARMSMNSRTVESQQPAEDGELLRETRFRISGIIRVSPAPPEQAINNTEIELAATSLQIKQMTRSTFH